MGVFTKSLGQGEAKLNQRISDRLWIPLTGMSGGFAWTSIVHSFNPNARRTVCTLSVPPNLFGSFEPALSKTSTVVA